MPNIMSTRNLSQPVPENFWDYMTPDQYDATRVMRDHGWNIHFIRREEGQEPTVVLKHESTGYLIHMLADGSWSDMPEIAIRD